MLHVKREMLAVFKTAAGKNGRHVRGDVRVGVAEVRTVEDHRAIEQRFVAFLYGLQFAEKFGKQFHVPFVDGLQLREFLL